MKTTIFYVGAFMIGISLGAFVAVAYAQEAEVVEEQELPPVVIEQTKDLGILAIMASSTTDLASATVAKYAREDTRELIKKLDVMIVLLSQINDKLTR